VFSPAHIHFREATGNLQQGRFPFKYLQKDPKILAPLCLGVKSFCFSLDSFVKSAYNGV
jgi:hypothetical protein